MPKPLPEVQGTLLGYFTLDDLEWQLAARMGTFREGPRRTKFGEDLGEYDGMGALAYQG